MSEFCTVCGLVIEVGDYPCITSARPHQRGINGAIGDECDLWQENGFKTPRHFTHKSELRRALAEQGLEINAANAGVHDKIMPRWASMDAYTLESARVLVSRNGSAQGKDAEPEAPLKVNWTIRELPTT